jgi:signal transduction histidine kinase
MKEAEMQKLLEKIQDLQDRLDESEQLVEAIKMGEVDAFAIRGAHSSEIYTLQTGDYAYRVLIEKFGEGALNVSEDGLIVYTNVYFTELLKLPYDRIIGSIITDFIDAASLSTFARLFEEALTGKGMGKSRGEINLKFGKTILPVYISLTSLQPKLPTVGIIITDLTQKKKNEETILRYQADLERKNQALAKSNTELASFAYIASHDLQEPLRKIKAFSNRIAEREAQNLSENGKDYLARMQNAVIRMQTLIEDILSYSRTNTTEKNFEPTDLNGILNEVKEELREELQSKNAVIESEKLCTIPVIPFQFRQLLHNIISNALKFSHPDRKPLLQIKSRIGTGSSFGLDLLSDDVSYCHFSIQDNGIGFESQYNEKIFEIFQRLHGKSDFKGTGIGLAIVKRIVENHGGIISANGEPDKGARFDIFIPLQ